ncbi:MAG: acetyltransferase [Spirochaetia bacterium]|nr:acetyltransferase [Spirochaetia bacterium]
MKRIVMTALLLCVALFATSVQATVRKSAYPVVFAHGLGGFDNLLGVFYFGDNVGNFVGDPCDALLETVCNGGLNAGQKAYAAQVTPFQSSEYRGTQLADQIQSYLTSVGATYVNVIGHSQGGIDARKAAKVLYQRKGFAVVKNLVSVQSPHRGSPVAKYILDLKPGVTSVVAALATFYGNTVYNSGNDAYGAAKQLVYNDYSSTDGISTGMKLFNTNYNVSATYIPGKYASIIGAQQGLDVNPALYILSKGFYDIDGDGYCVDDCDNDGAGGAGNGTRADTDDDGLVGINSAQMGYRLKYNECFLCDDYMTTDSTTGYVGNLNAPTSTQMTSKSSILNQDHLDPTGVGPDTMDENEFYAAIIDYFAANGG